MQKHSPFYATLLALLLPLAAAAQEPIDADAAGNVATIGETVISDQAVMEPVYAPGQGLEQPYDAGHYDGGHPEAAGGGEECGCPSCGHDDCSGCCGRECCCVPCRRHPLIVGRVNFLYLSRSEPDAVPLVSDGVTGVQFFGAEQFDFDWQPGVEGTFVCHLDPCWGVEGRYLWMDDWKAREPVTIPGGVPVLNTTPPTPAGDAVGFDYHSELQTAEISIRRAVHRAAGITAGFRYVKFDESLHADLIAAGAGSVAQFNTFNNLYGFQVGGDVVLLQRKWGPRVDGFVKGGVYWNDAQAEVSFVPAGGVTVDGSAAADRAAFLAEAGVFAGYNVTRHITVRVGYQIMWLDNVATASSQVGSTGLLTQPAGTPIPVAIDLGDGILIHGASGGIEARY
jgi:hypothetical protein